VLKNFSKYWKNHQGDEETRRRLVKLIVERVYVRDHHVVVMTLHSTYHLVLGHKMKEPTEKSVGSLCSVAGPTGLEPAISGLTGQYVSRLHHGPTLATTVIIHKDGLSSNCALRTARQGLVFYAMLCYTLCCRDRVWL
jgi:hypothetical protein